MALVAYPSNPAAAVNALRDRTRFTGSWLTLPDGQRLSLSDFSWKNPPWLGLGGVTLMPGVQGLGLPEWERHTSSSLLPGQHFLGARTKPREVFWPLMIWGTSRRGWYEVDRYFWSHIRPDDDLPLLWEWGGPDGQIRRLAVRPVAEESGPPEDPTRHARPVVRYGLSLVADRPFWETAQSPLRFAKSVDENWLPTEERPWVHVSSSVSLTHAVARVGGEMPAYPVWKVTGPAANVRLGLNGRFFELPWSFPAGSWVQIDARPDSPTGFGAWDNTGANVSHELGRFEPEAVPPNVDVPLTIQFDGSGTVEVALTPLWRRAW